MSSRDQGVQGPSTADGARSRLTNLLGRDGPHLRAKLDAVIEANAQLEERYASLKEAHEELRCVQEELRRHQTILEQENDNLRAPELHEARFIERDAGRAKVHYGGSNRLVTVDPPTMAALRSGQVVYLSRELNSIVKVSSIDEPEVGEVVTVERLAPDGRLSVRDRGEDMLVRVGGRLTGVSIEPGDEVIINRSIGMALEPAPAADRARETQDAPDTSPDAFAGFDFERDQVMKQFTWSLAYPELAAQYGVGENPSLLLEGPPGTGKSLLARAVRTTISDLTGRECRIAVMSGADLEDPYVGVTQQKIKKLFRDLSGFDGIGLLLLDEAEAIGRARGSAVGFHADRALNTWLSELDGIQGQPNLAVIATTNRRDLLDQAFADRFSQVVRLGRPGMEAAAEIFAVHLEESYPYRVSGREPEAARQEMIDVGVSLLYSPNAGNELSLLRFRDGKERTVSARELISGRLIKQCCVAAREHAFQRHADGGEPGLAAIDMEAAVGSKVDQLGTVLTTGNVHHYLPDLSTDIDVVSVERVRGNFDRRQYLS